MSRVNNICSANIFFLSYYYVLILLVGLLIVWKALPVDLARIFIGTFIVFGFLYQPTAYRWIKWDGRFFALLVFAVYAMVTGWWHHSFQPVMYAMGILIVYMLLLLYVSPCSQLQINNLFKKLGYITLFYFILNMLACILYKEQLIGTSTSHFYKGLLRNPNSSADVLYVGMIFTFLALFSSKKTREIILFCISLFLGFFFLLFTSSRSACFAAIFLFAGVFLFSFVLRFFKHEGKQTNFQIMWISLLAFFFVLGLLFLVGYGLHKGHYIAYFLSANLDGRQAVWQCAFHVLNSQPAYQLVGVGLGDNEWIFKSCGLAYTKAHNSMLDVLLATGYIGLAIFLVFIMSCLYFLIKRAIKKQDMFSIFLLLATVSLILHSFVESYLLNQLSPDLFCFFLLQCVAIEFVG